MVTTTAGRRATAPNPPAERAAVRAMLREIAYVLHVTRKVGRRIERPVAPTAVRSALGRRPSVAKAAV